MFPIPKWDYRIKPLQVRMNVRKFRSVMGTHRKPAGVALFSVFEAVPYKCDIREPVTVAAGAVGRLSRDIQPDNQALVDELESSVKSIMREDRKEIKVQPLPATVDLTKETWLAGTNYNQDRKDELLKAEIPLEELYCWALEWEKILESPQCWRRYRDKDWFEVGGFPKDEFLAAAKFSRGINARSDTFKIFFGPLEKAMSKHLYESPWFVKKVPVANRAAYIRERVLRFCNKYNFNDYSSFEAMFIKEIMSATNMQFYEYMLQNIPDHRKILRILRIVLTGLNRINYGLFKIIIEAVRMSGEMDTSSGNGWGNLMFFLFASFLIAREEAEEEFAIVTRAVETVLNNCAVDGVCAPSAHTNTVRCETDTPVGGYTFYSKNETGVIEGDDSETTVRGRPPGTAEFAKLGFVVKEEMHDDPGEGAFCGILEATDGSCIKDPVAILAKFPWLPQRYTGAKDHLLRTLYRCKALSLRCELPHCPIIRAFADSVVRLTHSTHNRVMKAARHLFDGYEYERFLAAIETPVADATISFEAREFMERKFGIAVGDQQRLEHIFAGARTLRELRADGFESILPDAWRSFYDVLVGVEERRETSTFPSTSANNAIINRLHSLIFQPPTEDRITVLDMMRSCGARA